MSCNSPTCARNLGDVQMDLEHWRTKAAELETQLKLRDASEHFKILSNTRDIFRGSQVMELYEKGQAELAKATERVNQQTQLISKLEDALRYCREELKFLSNNHAMEAGQEADELLAEVARQELKHFAVTPFVAVCGADETNQSTTTILAGVTCPACVASNDSQLNLNNSGNRPTESE